MIWLVGLYNGERQMLISAHQPGATAELSGQR